MTNGTCTNLPEACENAALKKPIPMTEFEPKCPLCSSALIAIKDGKPDGNRRLKLAIIPALLVLVGAGAYWGLSDRDPGPAESEVHTVVPAPAVQPAPTVQPAQPAPVPVKLVITPADAKVAMTLVSEGINLAKAGKYPVAADKFDQAAKKDANNDEAWGNLGSVFIAMGRHTEALAPTRKAVEIDPKNAVWHLNLAEVYSVSGDKNNALTQLDLAMKNGFSDLPKLKGFNFKNIENEPRFKELLRERKV